MNHASPILNYAHHNLAWLICCVFVMVFFLALPFAELTNNIDKTWVWQPGVIILNIQHPLTAEELRQQQNLRDPRLADAVPSINEIETDLPTDWIFISWRKYTVTTTLASPSLQARVASRRMTTVSFVVVPFAFLGFVVVLSKIPDRSNRRQLLGSPTLYRVIRIALLTLISVPVFILLWLALAPHYVS